MFGVTEWLIIAAILVILFGASRLPGIGEGVGRGIRNFRDSIRDKPKSTDTPDTKDKQE